MGWITGTYFDRLGISHGFLRDPAGPFVIIDEPGAATTISSAMTPTLMSPGPYIDQSRCLSRLQVWIRQLRHLRPTGWTLTFPASFNAGGLVTGSYSDSTGMNYGFLWQTDGPMLSFDPPGSIGTSPVGINATGEIAGYYMDSAGVPHCGFRLSPSTPRATLNESVSCEGARTRGRSEDTAEARDGPGFSGPRVPASREFSHSAQQAEQDYREKRQHGAGAGQDSRAACRNR